METVDAPVRHEWTQQEAADELGIPISTLKGWLARMPQIPRVERESDRARLLDSRALALLRVYKAMRDTNRSADSIRIAIDRLSVPVAPPSDGDSTPVQPPSDAPGVDLSAIASVVAAVLREELENQEGDDQNERIAELERRLARAETEAEQYKERFEEAKDRAEQLETQRMQLNQNMIALAREVAEQRKLFTELTALPPPPQAAAPVNSRPWWRIW